MQELNGTVLKTRSYRSCRGILSEKSSAIKERFRNEETAETDAEENATESERQRHIFEWFKTRYFHEIA